MARHLAHARVVPGARRGRTASPRATPRLRPRRASFAPACTTATRPQRSAAARCASELTPEVIGRCQADRLAADAPVESTRKALTLLGGILQRAVEARRIPSNPQRLVIKAPPAATEEVRPLPPATVEAIRAALSTRHALLVSLLAYSGIRPQEAPALRWQHVQDRTLVVHAPKTRRHRSQPRTTASPRYSPMRAVRSSTSPSSSATARRCRCAPTSTYWTGWRTSRASPPSGRFWRPAVTAMFRESSERPSDAPLRTSRTTARIPLYNCDSGLVGGARLERATSCL